MGWLTRVKCASCGGPVDKKAPRGSPLEMMQKMGVGAMKCNGCGQSFCVACYLVFFMKQPIDVSTIHVPAELEGQTDAKCLAMTAMLGKGQAPCPSCKAEKVSYRGE